MNRRKRKSYIFSILLTAAFLFLVLPSAAQTARGASNDESGVISAFLDEASRKLAEGAYQQAFELADSGSRLAPDVADFQYIQAAALSAMGREPYMVLPHASAAAGGSWARYNGMENRILLASLLNRTGRSSEALAALNGAPRIPVSYPGALLERIRALYMLGDAAAARSAMEQALGLYPDDSRFPMLFFTHELILREKTGTQAPEAKRVADIVIPRLPSLEGDNPLVSVYAVPFISSAAERVRILRAFRAAGHTDPLWTVLALKDGLVSDADAFAQIRGFAESEGELAFPLFASFVSSIGLPDTRAAVEAWLSTFAGTFVWDVNGDGVIDLRSRYEAGRPASFSYDRNQDGLADISVTCDFGAPAELLTGDGVSVSYGVYPSVRSAEFPSGTVFTLVPGALKWSPIPIQAVTLRPLTAPVFIPVPASFPEVLSEKALVTFSSRVDVPSDERPGARIAFTLSGGIPVSSVTSRNGAPYAHTEFSRGIPVKRVVDGDGDGFYELTEIYEYIPGIALTLSGKAARPASPSAVIDVRGADPSAVLYGRGAPRSDVALSEIRADTDMNGMDEYIERFTYPPQNMRAPDGSDGVSRTVLWDTDGDGAYDTGYVLHADGRAEYLFLHPVSGQMVTVSLADGVPVSVTEGDEVRRVRRDPHADIYWIGSLPEETDLKTRAAVLGTEVLNAYNREGVPGVSYLIRYGKLPVIVVSAGGFYFGEIIDE